MPSTTALANPAEVADLPAPKGNRAFLRAASPAHRRPRPPAAPPRGPPCAGRPPSAPWSGRGRRPATWAASVTAQIAVTIQVRRSLRRWSAPRTTDNAVRPKASEPLGDGGERSAGIFGARRGGCYRVTPSAGQGSVVSALARNLSDAASSSHARSHRPHLERRPGERRGRRNRQSAGCAPREPLASAARGSAAAWASAAPAPCWWTARRKPACDLEIGGRRGQGRGHLRGPRDAGAPRIHCRPPSSELQAGQCGYCLSGILVGAKALLDRNPDPSREEIATALSWHLCRCGVHNRVLDAVALAARRLREGAPA